MVTRSDENKLLSAAPCPLPKQLVLGTCTHDAEGTGEGEFGGGGEDGRGGGRGVGECSEGGSGERSEGGEGDLRSTLGGIDDDCMAGCVVIGEEVGGIGGSSRNVGGGKGSG